MDGAAGHSELLVRGSGDGVGSGPGPGAVSGG